MLRFDDRITKSHVRQLNTSVPFMVFCKSAVDNTRSIDRSTTIVITRLFVILHRMVADADSDNLSLLPKT